MFATLSTFPTASAATATVSLTSGRSRATSALSARARSTRRFSPLPVPLTRAAMGTFPERRWMPTPAMAPLRWWAGSPGAILPRRHHIGRRWTTGSRCSDSASSAVLTALAALSIWSRWRRPLRLPSSPTRTPPVRCLPLRGCNGAMRLPPRRRAPTGTARPPTSRGVVCRRLSGPPPAAGGASRGGLRIKALLPPPPFSPSLPSLLLLT